MKSSIIFRKLPEMRTKIDSMEKDLDALKKK
jgi:hypothetical protein